ncbi:SMR domain-containing protein [Ananas comosus]|uniref:SMR domain-containing protein n=1 Tax=Ananas comosus TaxID=4615 RepID=A0A199VYQ6_ANACO|nr:SMR domain-containing protein [Ananas comosus]
MKPSQNKKKSRKKKPKPSSPAPPPSQRSGAESKGDEGIGGEKAEGEERKDLDWLIDAFGSVSVDQIESVYREAGGDAYKAAGILGAHLEDPGEAPASSGGGCGRGDGGGGGGGRRARRKPKRVAAATGMVSDVIGKSYSSPEEREGRAEEEKRRGDAEVEDAEQFLCSMLGDSSDLGMGVVRDVLGQCGCDVEKALEVLLDLAASSYNQHKERSYGNHGKSCMDYSIIFRGMSSKNTRENNINSFQSPDNTGEMSCHSSEKEQEFPQYAGYDSRHYMKDLPDSDIPTMGKSEMQHKILESLFGVTEYPKYEPNRMNWKKVVKKLESFGQGLEFNSPHIIDTGENTISGKGDGYQEFRGVASKHWDTMKTYYQKAALAYSRGERAYASHLSEKGKYFRELALEADEKASREIFEARNKSIRNTVTIDLHGQHVKQAIGLLKLHLLLFSYIPSVHFLRVITGCGVDGVGRGKLKCSVIGLAKKEGIEWSEENAGTVILRLDGARKYSFAEGDSDSE